MILKYSLSEGDMLTHQLYLASQSERIKKKRFINRAIVPFFYLLIAAWYFYQDKTGLSIMVFILFLAWYFLFPLWEKKHYISHYQAFIREHFHAKVGRPSSLEFKDGALITKDNGTETYILAGEITQIVELPTIILVKILSGEAVVIALEDIENVDRLRTYLKTMASNLNVEYKSEPKWAWK